MSEEWLGDRKPREQLPADWNHQERAFAEQRKVGTSIWFSKGRVEDKPEDMAAENATEASRQPPSKLEHSVPALDAGRTQASRI